MDERTAWEPFLNELPNLLNGPLPFSQHNSLNPESLSAVFGVLEQRLEDVNQFNTTTRRAAYGGAIGLPPRMRTH